MKFLRFGIRIIMILFFILLYILLDNFNAGKYISIEVYINSLLVSVLLLVAIKLIQFLKWVLGYSEKAAVSMSGSFNDRVEKLKKLSENKMRNCIRKKLNYIRDNKKRDRLLYMLACTLYVAESEKNIACWRLRKRFNRLLQMHGTGRIITEFKF